MAAKLKWKLYQHYACVIIMTLIVSCTDTTTAKNESTKENTTRKTSVESTTGFQNFVRLEHPGFYNSSDSSHSQNSTRTTRYVNDLFMRMSKTSSDVKQLQKYDLEQRFSCNQRNPWENYFSVQKNGVKRNISNGLSAPPVNLRSKSSAIRSSRNKAEFFSLEKSLRPRLLMQVFQYLGVRLVTLVMSEHNEDMCLSFAWTLYKKSTSVSCTTLDKLYGYHLAVVLIANDKDDGNSISENLSNIANKMEQSDIFVSRVAVVLFSSRATLGPVMGRIRYCVVQMKEGGVEFKEVFTFWPDSKHPAEEIVAWWNPKDSASPMPSWIDQVLPNDFRGNPIRVAYIESRPEIMMTKDANNKTQLIGYSVEVLRILQEALNFTIKWVTPDDDQMGMELENGSHTGLVGLLQRKEADIAVTSFYMSPGRDKVMDFSSPVESGGLRLVIFQTATQGSFQWQTYTGEFHWLLWVAILCFWLLMSLIMTVVTRQDPEITICHALFIFVGVMAQKGYPTQPKCGLGRLVFISFWLTCLVLYAHYTASLTSKLTATQLRDPFTSLSEAIKAGYYVVVQNGTNIIDIVQEQRHKSETHQKLYEQWKANPELVVASDEEGMTIIQSKKKIAYLKFTRVISEKIRNNCSFSWVGMTFNKQASYFGYTQHLPYAKILSHYINKAATTGVLDKLRKKWWGEEVSCKSDDYEQQGFAKTISAFVLLLVGILLATVIQVAERMFYRRNSLNVAVLPRRRQQ